MTSPGSGRPREDSLAGPVGRGEVPPPEHFEEPAPLTVLPDHLHTSESELLAGVRKGDGLAFVELYQRTAPAAHAVSRRLLANTNPVEAALRRVYADLWLNPPSGSVVQWIRARCFAVATADLRRRRAAPGEASLRTILPDLPAPTVHHISQVERALIDMPEAQRLAVLLAHDAGIASWDQADPEAGACLEAGLIELADPGSLADGFAPSRIEALSDWVLGLLSEPHARTVAAAVAADEQLAARVAILQMGRRRLEGLPASPNTSQRILGHVLASSPVAAPSDPEIPQPVAAATAPRGNRRGLGLVAASLVLVLLAGVAVLTSRSTAGPQLAAAQAAAPPARPTGPGAPNPEPSPPTERGRPSTAAARIVPPSRNRPRVKPVAPPVRVAVPKMNVDKRLIGLGVLNDGTLAAPDDYGTPGWFKDGVAPGDVGPAVIVGHVDSEKGPAVFFKLETLRRGDKAMVKRADGTTATFVIDRVEVYAKDAFPTERVYGPTLGPELRLITCGGAFDNTTLSYDDNVVAFAHLQQPRAGSRKNRGDRDRGGNERARDQKADALPEYDHLGRLRKPSAPQGRDDKDRNRNRNRNPEPADAAADA